MTDVRHTPVQVDDAIHTQGLDRCGPSLPPRPTPAIYCWPYESRPFGRTVFELVSIAKHDFPESIRAVGTGKSSSSIELRTDQAPAMSAQELRSRQPPMGAARRV